MNVAPEVLAFIALAVSILSGYLRDDKQSVGINALFAAVALVLIAVFAYWMTNGFTANFHDSVLGILGFMAYLVAHEAQALLVYIQAANSPTAPAVPADNSLAAKRAQAGADALNARYNTGPMGGNYDERGL
jgi:ABC-type lipoprotein release transport system permease subunit